MNKFSSLKHFALTGCIAALVIACTQRLDGHAGIEGTGDAVASRGVVTKLGSIYVNGIHFETDTAEIYVNDELTTEDVILQGMVVNVEGSVGRSANEAIAHKVHFDYLVTGEIEAVSVNDDNVLVLSMLGYSIVVPENTLFKGTDYDHLSVGDVISVSGLEVNETTLYASQIKSSSETGEAALQGRIKQIDASSNTFIVNDVTIDYSGIDRPDFNPANLQEDEKIRVRGAFIGADRQLNARSFQNIVPYSYPEQATVTEEGFIYQYQSIQAFKLNGVTVDASSATFSGGDAQNLADQLRVSVRGTFRNTVLVADKVHMILPSNLKTSGLISQVDAINHTLTVEELTFKVSPFTTFDDKGAQANRYFNLNDLNTGDHVEIYAVKDQDGWSANTIIRQPQNSEPFSIKGEIVGFNPQGNIYLQDMLVIIDNIPLQNRWPYMIGDSIFVMGMIVDGNIIYAQDIFPAITGCSRWDLELCPPEPDLLLPPYHYQQIDWPPHF